jgi:hypothetical protein
MKNDFNSLRDELVCALREIVEHLGDDMLDSRCNRIEELKALSDPSAELLEALKAIVDNTYVGQHHAPVNSRSSFGNYRAQYYHRAVAAISRALPGGEGK